MSAVNGEFFVRGKILQILMRSSSGENHSGMFTCQQNVMVKSCQHYFIPCSNKKAVDIR